MFDVIAIDGPTSSGKNSVAHLFAQKIGYKHFDSGDIYRAFCIPLVDQSISEEDDKKIDQVLNKIKLDYLDEGFGRWLLDGVDITDRLHSPEVTKIVPDVASKLFVREHATRIQREMASTQNTVVTGRDIGTVVFPDAKLKFYLTAEVETRAKRRFEQFQKKGLDISFEQVLKDLVERDFKDMTRALSPLKIAPGATIIDTTHLTTEQSVEKFLEEYEKVKS